MTQASGQYFVLSAIPHEIVVGMIAFAILYVLLSRVILPRLNKIYNERHDRIDGGFERAEQARAEARRADEEYRTRINRARDEATRIRDAAREEGQRRPDPSQERALVRQREAVVNVRSVVGRHPDIMPGSRATRSSRRNDHVTASARARAPCTAVVRVSTS
jgi:hypothetical protein